MKPDLRGSAVVYGIGIISRSKSFKYVTPPPVGRLIISTARPVRAIFPPNENYSIILML